MRFFFDSITSKSYWQYVLMSRSGAESVLAIFGGFWLIVSALDFFKIYTRDQYASYAFLVFLVLSIVCSIVLRRPIRSVCLNFPQQDFTIEVRVADIFDVTGAVVVSTNTTFEADVAAGKISPDSLQGQFTARYYTGSQAELIGQIQNGLTNTPGTSPYQMGTTVPIVTHGKSFYLTAMAEISEQGNARSTLNDITSALDGLWRFVGDAGELQELAIPVIGTGRGRVKISRKKMISIIAESFVRASSKAKFTERLIIVVRPQDAANFSVNLYDIRDNLLHTLKS